MATVTFNQMLERRDWRPIPNCPGRFVLAAESRRLSFEELAGIELRPTSHDTPFARDTVLVVALVGGGLISYLRSDGSFVHTLNTTEGFERKLRQLGIDTPRSD